MFGCAGSMTQGTAFAVLHQVPCRRPLQLSKGADARKQIRTRPQTFPHLRSEHVVKNPSIGRGGLRQRAFENEVEWFERLVSDDDPFLQHAPPRMLDIGDACGW